MADLLGGQVVISFAGIAGSIEHVRSGKLRALAVTTAARSPALPDLPTVSEFVPGFEAGDGTPLALTPAEFGKLLADETEKWGKVIRAANIKPQG